MDIATLGLRIDASDVPKATAQLNTFTAAGDKAEASVKKLSVSNGGLSSSASSVTGALSRTEQETLRLVGAHEQHAFATGKAIRALEGLSVEAVGANHQLATLGVVLGEFVSGHAAVLAVLAAVGIGLKVYETMTEETKKAREEQDKLADSLAAWYKTLSEGGEAAQQIAAMRQRVVELREELEKLEQHNPLAAAKDIGIAGWLRTLLSGSPTAMMTQFGIEVGKAFAGTQKAAEDGTAAIDKKQQAEALDTATLALQVERQNALNASFLGGETAAAHLNVQYDLRATLAQNAVKYTGQERAVMDALAKALAHAKDVSIDLAAAEKDRQDQIAAGIALGDKMLAQLQKTNVEWTINAQNYQRIIDLNKQLNEAHESLGAVAEKNTKKMADDIDKTAESIRKADQYTKDLQTIWRDGLGKIATNGMKSWQDFFDDVFQLFSNLMKKMEERAKELKLEPGGLAYNALGVGSAALAGGMAGYGVASQTGSTAAGVGSGILSGAVAGSAFGPWGVAIGAVAGLTGGLLGGAEAAKKRREAEDALRASLEQSLNQMRVQAGTMTDLANSIANAHTSAQQLRDEIDKAYPGLANQATRERLLAETRTDEAAIVQKLTDAETKRLNQQEEQNRIDLGDLAVRQLVAQGHSDEADAMRRQLEVQKAINEGRSDEYIAALELANALEALAAANQKANDAFFAQADADWKQVQQQRDAANQAAKDAHDTIMASLNAQMKAAKDQLQLADAAAKASKAAFDSLSQFRASLTVGNLSVLSPIDQLNAQKAVVQDLYRRAQLGDASAASSFGSAAQAFLQLSQGYNASGLGYVTDQSTVQKMTDDLVKQYGVQSTIDQQMLDSANQQVTLLQQQIDAIQNGAASVVAAINGTLHHFTPNGTDTGIPQAYYDNYSANDKRRIDLMDDPAALAAYDARNKDAADAARKDAEYQKARKEYYDAYGADGSDTYTLRQYLHDEGIPGYASGSGAGFTRSGLIRVGEHGPELMSVGPSRVFNEQQLNAPTVEELRALREDVADLTAALRAGFRETVKTTATLGEQIADSGRQTARSFQQKAKAS